MRPSIDQVRDNKILGSLIPGEKIYLHIAKIPDNKRKPAVNLKQLLSNSKGSLVRTPGPNRTVTGVPRVALPPVGSSFRVTVSPETIGRMNSVREFVVLSRFNEYVLFLDDPTQEVTSATGNSASSLILERFQSSLNKLKKVLADLGSLNWIDNNTGDHDGMVVASSEEELEKNTQTLRVQTFPVVNAAIVSVPESDVEKFESEMRRHNIDFSPISPLPIHVALTPKSANVSSIGMSENVTTAGQPDSVGKDSPETKKIRIGIVDTGFNPTDPLLSSRPIEFAAFDQQGLISGTNAEESDDLGHGTEVCRILCESTPKNIDLIVAMALPKRTGTINQILGAINWLVLQKEVHVLNFSFVTTDKNRLACYNTTLKKLMQSIIEVAEASDGFWIVGATGNHGYKRVGSPGAFRGVIGVGAVGADGKFSTRSGYGHVLEEGKIFKPDYLASGLPSAAGRIPASEVWTSYATPRVSAYVARALSNGLNVENALVAAQSIEISLETTDQQSKKKVCHVRSLQMTPQTVS